MDGAVVVSDLGQDRGRRLGWPCAQLTPLDRADLRALASLTDRTVSAVVREGLKAYLTIEHRRLYPDVPDPWNAGLEAGGVQRLCRVAEPGAGAEVVAVRVAVAAHG